MNFIVRVCLNFALIVISSRHTYSREGKIRCLNERAHSMMAFSCKDMKLNEIPKYLSTKTEVLDASENRIRRLTVASFENYQDLRFIYLFNNKINRIDAGTFRQLNDLEVLDLSDNNLRVVPAELIELPKLRRLYVAENDLRNEGFVTVERSIRAPLEALNLASTGLERIPNFGLMSKLTFLNVSNNPLTQIQPEQFAPFCILKTVDWNRTEFDSCMCHNINSFFKDELHKSPLLECKGNIKNCKMDNSTTRLNKDYITCTNEVREKLLDEEKPNIALFDVPKVSWPIPAFFAVIFFLIIAMISAHCMQKPRRRDTSQTNGNLHIQETTMTSHIPAHQAYQLQQIEMDQPFKVNPGSRSTLIW